MSNNSDLTANKKADSFTLLPMPDGLPRMESGVVQFGDDWKGVFLRGDEALHLASIIGEAALMSAENGDIFFSNTLRSASKALAKCRA